MGHFDETQVAFIDRNEYLLSFERPSPFKRLIKGVSVLLLAFLLI
jgi:hypothetical protein